MANVERVTVVLGVGLVLAFAAWTFDGMYDARKKRLACEASGGVYMKPMCLSPVQVLKLMYLSLENRNGN